MRKIKNFIFVLLMSVCTIQGFSQDKIDEYSLLYFEKTYDISATENTLYISLPSADRHDIVLVQPLVKLEVFVNVVDSLKVKYIEWSDLADSNNIDNLDKEIDIPELSSRYEFAFSMSKWYFSNRVKLKVRFKIINGEKLLIIQNKHKLISNSNEYIDADGFYLVFSSVEEFDLFLLKLTISNVEKHFENKNKKEEIFK